MTDSMEKRRRGSFDPLRPEKITQEDKTMKNYFVEFTNGSYEWFEAKTDDSAFNKAWKMAKKEETGVRYLSECFEESEEDRLIYKR